MAGQRGEDGAEVDPRWIPLRSLLFTPGDNARMLGRAVESCADGLIFDLEDAVAASRKAAARELTRERIATGGGGQRLFARVNSVQSGVAQDDLEAIVVPGLDGVWLPKVERPEDVATVNATICKLERRQGIPVGRIGLFASLETALGVWRAHEIATASARMAGLSVGTAAGGDLEADVGCQLSPDGRELDYARSHVLFAARAAGLEVVLDGAYTDFLDPGGLGLSATAARRLGYTGKMVIHPGQIAEVNARFSPTADEIDNARRTLAAFQEALARGAGATSVDGRMVDYAMAASAQILLRRAEACRANIVGS